MDIIGSIKEFVWQFPDQKHVISLLQRNKVTSALGF